MNLHAIPQEITRPILDLVQERAIAAFQRENNNLHPVTLQVTDNRVLRVLFRNGYFPEDRPLQEFSYSEMQSWVEGRYQLWRETDEIQWNLITIENI